MLKMACLDYETNDGMLSIEIFLIFVLKQNVLGKKNTATRMKSFFRMMSVFILPQVIIALY